MKRIDQYQRFKAQAAYYLVGAWKGMPYAVYTCRVALSRSWWVLISALGRPTAVRIQTVPARPSHKKPGIPARGLDGFII